MHQAKHIANHCFERDQCVTQWPILLYRALEHISGNTFSPTRHINDSRRSSISVGSDVLLLLWAWPPTWRGEEMDNESRTKSNLERWHYQDYPFERAITWREMYSPMWERGACSKQQQSTTDWFTLLDNTHFSHNSHHGVPYTWKYKP